MHTFDWIASVVIFVSIITVMFLTLPHLFPERPRAVSETTVTDILNQVSADANIKSLIYVADCNDVNIDCNASFPVEVTVREEVEYIPSKKGEKFKKSLFIVSKPNTSAEVFEIPPNTLDFQRRESDLGADSNSTGIYVTNSYIKAIFDGNKANIYFFSSNNSKITFYYEGPLSLLKDTNYLVVVGNNEKELYFIFFPETPEFWVYVPEDGNIAMESSLYNWGIENTYGMNIFASWWDSNTSDDEMWHYRLPITVYSGSCTLNNAVLKLTIDFNEIKNDLNISYNLDPNSFRMVEYNGTEPLGLVPYKVTYNETTGTATLLWQLTGTTQANTVRQFYLYFDFWPFLKSPPQYSDISYSSLSCEPLVIRALPEGTRVRTSTKVSGLGYLFNPYSVQVSIINDVKRMWLYSNLTYRIPIVFDAGNIGRSDVNVSLTIDFGSEFVRQGCNDCTLDVNSVKIVEVYDIATGNLKEELARGSYWNLSYNYGTKKAFVWFIVKGTTNAGEKRYYHLYYKAR